MADYYPLVAKAVAGLEKNTGEGRRLLYERARSALVAQLRGMNDPPLTEAEITRERLALEEAIRKVEAEAARRGRDAPRPEPAAPKADTVPDSAPPRPASSAPPPAPERPAAPVRPRAPSRTVTEEGMKGFRDVIAEAEALGDATAQGAKTAREAYAATPPTGQTNFDRVEPRVEPEGLRTPVRPAARSAEPAAQRPVEPPTRPIEPPARVTTSSPFDGPGEPQENWAEPERVEPRAGQQRQGPMRQPSADDIDDLPRGSRAGLIAAILVVLLIIGLGVAAYWQRDRIASLFNAVRGQPQQQQQKDAGAQKPKITDRVGQPSSPSETPAAPANPATGATAAVAQRVALYEEDPSDQQGKRFVGQAIWRTEMWSAGPGSPPDPAIRADIEIPERRITMSMLIHRDLNQVQQATSHTIEITFNLPADFPFGGIQNVPGVLMKQAEQTRGSPLGGAAARVTSGFFLIGLSAVETDMQRNIQLLKERSWFDIPIVYNNGRRAILAIEKGTPGERVFEEVFKAWGQ
ncbi:MAG: hypothetical protein WDO17_23840 [Alphaproteobacteria bacterium]